MTNQEKALLKNQILTRDEKEYLRLGREMVRMIRDVKATAVNGACSYAHRTLTFPDSSVEVFICSEKELADKMETAAAHFYAVKTIGPPSSELQ